MSGPRFPGWWILSAEGLGLIGDAVSNAVGFAVLKLGKDFRFKGNFSVMLHDLHVISFSLVTALVPKRLPFLKIRSLRTRLHSVEL